MLEFVRQDGDEEEAARGRGRRREVDMLGYI